MKKIVLKHLPLVHQFVKRDILSRYRGSMLGMGWMLANPLLMLGLYTFAFAGILQTRWPGAEGLGGTGYAMNLFAGLIIFNFFAEVCNKAPGLVVQHANLVKKVVFPISILSWVGVLSATVPLIFGFMVILISVYFVFGNFYLSAISFPIIVLAFIPFLLGLCWFLSAAGVYFRDLSQIMNLVVNLCLFLSPIFYPSSALPDFLSGMAWINPLTLIVEQSRMALIAGLWPDWTALAFYAVISILFAVLGYIWFGSVRKGFSDVL